MNLVFLVCSVAFFCLPEFRQSFQVPLLEAGQWEWLLRAGAFSPQALDQWAREAEQQRDARTLAFVAVHHPDEAQKTRLADRATALDPDLSWVYWNLGLRRSRDPKTEERIAQLQAWDPDNAVPYLLEAERIFDKQSLSRRKIPEELNELAKESVWREAMSQAFEAPRYDSYGTQRFELERDWLRERNLDRPAVVLSSLASYAVPSLLNIRWYAKLLVLKLGPEAEQAGRVEEAARHYWTVARFGERMHLDGLALMEKLIGQSLQIEAYPRLASLLRRTGRAEEAATLEYLLEEIYQRRAIADGQDPLAQSTNYNWAALTVQLCAALVVIFGVLTVLCFGYLIAKSWVRREKMGRLYQLAIIGQNYVPVLLFLACLALYISYYPYAQNFKHYMAATGESYGLEPFFYNVFPTLGAVPGAIELPAGNPFRPYGWYALAGVALVVLFRLLCRRRASQTEAPGGV